MIAASITTAEQHEAALIELERLIRSDPQLGTPEGDRLAALADEIERYEDLHFPLI